MMLYIRTVLASLSGTDYPFLLHLLNLKYNDILDLNLVILYENI